MAETRKRGGNIFRKYFRLVILFLSLSSLHAQEISDAQNELDVRIVSESLIANRSITLSITLPEVDIQTVSWQLPEMSAGLRYVQNPRLQGRRLNASASLNDDEADLIVVLRAKNAGRYIFPSFVITDNRRSYTTSAILLEVYQNETSTEIPPAIHWVGPDTLYAGESALFILQLKKSPEFIFPEDIIFASSHAGLIEEVFGVGAVHSEIIGDTELFTIPIVSILFTSVQQGNVVLPYVDVLIDGKKYRSDPVTITINPLPEILRSIAAIGDITFSHSVSTLDTVPGEPIILTIQLEGSGNLPFISIPDPLVQGLIESNREEINDYTTDERGYWGYRALRIAYDAPAVGDYRIQIPPLNSMDIKNNTIKTQSAHNYLINVVSDVTVQEDVEVFELWSSDQILENIPSRYHQMPLMYLLLLPGLMLLLFSIIKNRFRWFSVTLLVLLLSVAEPNIPLLREKIDTATSMYNTGEYEAALKSFLALSQEQRQIPGLQYNAALCYIAMEQIPQAIFTLRKALAIDSQNTIFRNTLNAIEGRGDLTRQIPAPEFLNADYFFFILLVIWNMSCVIAAFMLYRKRHALLVLFSSFVLALCIVATVLLWNSMRAGNQNIGIVQSSEASIKRIPEPDTSAWLILQPGLSVTVEGGYGDFYRVLTAYGVEGWVEQKILLYDGRYSTSISRDR